MRIALVADGTELSRQIMARPSLRAPEEVQRRLAGFYPGITVDLLTDIEAARALTSGSVNGYAALCFLSNSLRDENSAVVHALSEDRLQSYEGRGNGIVVLHQQLVGPVPGFGEELKLARRGDFEQCPHLVASQVGDPLLNFPERIDLESRTVAITTSVNAVVQTHWRHVVDYPPAQLRPVVVDPTAGEEVILRSMDPERRVVVSAMPLDWREDWGLLTNAIHFCLGGHPDRVLVRSPADLTSEQLANILQEDQRTTSLNAGEVHPIPSDRTLWAMQSVSTALFPADIDLEASPAAHALLRSGGVAIQPSGDGPVRSRGLRIWVGPSLLREAESFLWRLHIDPGWRRPRPGWELRNVLIARAVLRDVLNEAGLDAPVSLSEDADLAAAVVAELQGPELRLDVSSLIAYAAVLRALDASSQSAPLQDLLRMHMTETSDEVIAVQAEGALLLLTDGVPTPAWLRRCVDAARSSTSVLHVAGILSAVMAFSATGRISCPDDSVEVVHPLAVEITRRVGAPGPDGWFSIDTTSEISHGLAVLGCMGADERLIAQALVPAIRVLRRQLGVTDGGSIRRAPILGSLATIERLTPTALGTLLKQHTPVSQEPVDRPSLMALGEIERLRHELSILAGQGRAARVGRFATWGLVVVGVAALIVATVAGYRSAAGWEELAVVTAAVALALSLAAWTATRMLTAVGAEIPEHLTTLSSVASRVLKGRLG